MSKKGQESVIDAEVPGVPEQPEKPKGVDLVPVDGAVFQKSGQLVTMGEKIVEAGLAPSGMNAAGAFAAIVMGRGFGLNEMASIQNICAVNGTLSWRGQAAAALIRNSPKCVDGSLRFWCDGEGADMRGIAVAHRSGYKEADRREFSLEDAKRAGLYPGKERSAWRTYTKRMLQWRALGLLARDVFSDVLGGFPLAEEAVDFEDRARSSKPSQPPEGSRPEMLPPPASPDPLVAKLGGPAPEPKEPEQSAVAEEAQVAHDEKAERITEQLTLAQDEDAEDVCKHNKLYSEACELCDADDRAGASGEEGATH